MNDAITRHDDMKTYNILMKLLDGKQLNGADRKYISLLRLKMQTALSCINKSNVTVYTEVIGKYCVIEHYISLFSGMLFEGGDNE